MMIRMPSLLVATTCATALVALAPAQNLEKQTIDQTTFATNLGPIGTFAAVNGSLTDGKWTLTPNAEVPHNCFGVLDGPTVAIDPAPAGEHSSTAGFIVNFSFNSAATGLYPELRLRMNSADFGQYSIGGVGSNRLQQLRDTGRGQAVVTFDRTRITQTTNFRFFIDFLSAYEPGTVDPQFSFTIDSVEYFVSSPGGGSEVPRNQLFSAAFLEDDNDVVAYIGDSRSRTRVYDSESSTSNTSFAYDDSYMIVIEDEKLYGFSLVSNLTQVDIEDSRVESAAISGPWVLWVETDQDVKVYNFETNEKRTIAQNEEYSWASSAGDGSLLFLEDAGSSNVKVWRYNTRLATPVLERLNDTEEFSTFFTRSTRRR